MNPESQDGAIKLFLREKVSLGKWPRTRRLRQRVHLHVSRTDYSKRHSDGGEEKESRRYINPKTMEDAVEWALMNPALLQRRMVRGLPPTASCRYFKATLLST